MKNRMIGILLFIAGIAGGVIPQPQMSRADDPAPKQEQTTKDFEIRLPQINDPAPLPVAPKPVMTLPSGRLYVIDASKACDVSAYCSTADPTSVVKIRALKGPTTVYGLFADNSSTVHEVREFLGPFVYVVSAAGTSGRVNLVVTPFGFKKATEKVVVTLDVGGVAPPPDPSPSVDKFVEDLKKAINKEATEEKKYVLNLIKFYQDTVMQVDSQDTWVGLYRKMQELAASNNVAGRVKEVQTVIAKQFEGELPFGKVSETDRIGDKAKTKAAFQKVINALQKAI